ncbi:copper-binding protein [Sulfuricurvum sp.]|uniref:copper-binding protein n=1 Tax=Sulfuricurvum sp. TaxID=2025608 RepID=UPI00262AEC6E|nr:copper-binding protein [Sulfuricurvum sp.]MDD2782496.1 copper-binding protein [Sulfuricurvum sp.]
MKLKLSSALFYAALGMGSLVFAMGDEHRDHQQHSMVSEKTIHATGMVKSLAQNHETLRIFHDPIPELKWPSMNMAFEVSDHELTHPLEVGDRVNFEFIQKEGKNIIVRMKKQ